MSILLQKVISMIQIIYDVVEGWDIYHPSGYQHTLSEYNCLYHL